VRCKLGEVARFIDYRGKTPPKTTYGIPLVTAKIIKENVIQAPTEYIAADYYDDWMRRGIPNKGDVVFTTEAPLGEIAQIKTADKLAFAQRIIVLQGKQNELENDFLFYLLQYEPVKERIRARSTGTTVTGIKAAELRQVEIDLPDLDAQRVIAATLSALDARIAENRKINHHLEQMAHAIFKSWFVDFEPFGGVMPEGWTTGKVGDVVRLQRGHDLLVSTVTNGNYPVIGSKGVIAYHNKYTSRAPVIILGRSGNIGLPRYYNQDCWAHNTAIYSKELYGAPLWVFFALCQIDYSAFKGGSAVPTLNRNHVESQQILIPPMEAQNSFHEIIAPIYRQRDALVEQSRTLVALRDTLLPRLMSGELSVADLAAK